MDIATDSAPVATEAVKEEATEAVSNEAAVKAEADVKVEAKAEAAEEVTGGAKGEPAGDDGGKASSHSFAQVAALVSSRLMRSRARARHAPLPSTAREKTNRQAVPLDNCPGRTAPRVRLEFRSTPPVLIEVARVCAL